MSTATAVELTAQQRAEVGVRDMLVDHALAAVARAGLPADLEAARPAVRDRAVLAVAIAHLIVAGAIGTPDPRRLAWAPHHLPEHLRPDVDRLLAAAAGAHHPS